MLKYIDMSFEKNILNKIRGKKNNNTDNDKKDSMDEYIRKVTIVIFIIFLLYLSYTSFSENKDGIKDLVGKNNDAEKNISEKIDDNYPVDINNYTDIDSNNTKNQKYYTIIGDDFILKSDNDFMFINLTGKKNSELDIKIEYDNNIVDFKKKQDNKYLENFQFLDKEKEYILFIENISEITDIKKYLQDNNFKKIFFNII